MKDPQTDYLTLDDYLEGTYLTAVYPEANSCSLNEMAYLALGLAGETGEAVDCVKKMYRSQELLPEQIEKLREELGDILWYWVRLSVFVGVTPDRILRDNLAKLQNRKKSGTLKVR